MAQFDLNAYKLADGKFMAYAWPGGYPVFYLCSDGEALCPKCVADNIALIEESIRENSSDGWLRSRRQ